MELFHEFYSSQCQFAFDLFARAERQATFTGAELDALLADNHARDYDLDLKRQMVSLGVLVKEGSGFRTAPEFPPFRAPLPRLERSYLKHICTQPEAALFLPDETRQKILAGLADVDVERFSMLERPQRPEGPEVAPQTFRAVLRAVSQGRSLSYHYRTRQAETPRPVDGVVPYRMEYSVLDGRWWVILYLPEEDRTVKARLEHLDRVVVGAPHGVEEGRIRAAILRLVEPEPVVLSVSNRKNALERAFLTFENSLDLTARRVEEDRVEMRFSLFRFDRRDVIKKLLFLGEEVTLLSPHGLREELREKLQACLSKAGTESANQV